MEIAGAAGDAHLFRRVRYPGGDTARSCADLELHVVFVTLVSRAGYFQQKVDANGQQIEQPDWWEPAKWCTSLDAMVAVHIGGRAVWIRPWLYVHTCPHGHQIPILLLDTDLDQNSVEDRTLTHYLYGGDEAYRMKQEIILGIGGLRLLRALGGSRHFINNILIFDIFMFHSSKSIKHRTQQKDERRYKC